MQTTYRALLRDRRVALLIVLGVFIRLPASAGLVLTFYVVQTLQHSYAAAGLVATSFTIGAAIGAPWRGRRVDVVGLRKALILPIILETSCFAAASVSPYWTLVPLVFVAGLFSLPSFSVIRQSLVVLVPIEQRRTALSLDSIGVELSFMAGPALATVLSTSVSPGFALQCFAGLGLVGGLALFWFDPPVRSGLEPEEATPETGRIPSWLTPQLLVVLAVSSGATIVLYGTDVSIFARLREIGQLPQAAIVFPIWSLGSVLGALLYGRLVRPPAPAWLLLGLALSTAPIALAHSVFALSAWAFLAGGLCAPVITATAEAITHLVPERRRGTALGWHGSALTVGGAIAGPSVGALMDRFGPGAGPLSVAAAGAFVAVVGLVAGPSLRRVRRGRAARSTEP